MQKAIDSPIIRFGSIVGVAFLATCIAIFSFNLFAPPRPLAQLLPTRTATRRPPPTITPVAYPPTPQLYSKDDLRAQKNFPKASGVNLGYEYTQDGYLLTPPLDPGFVRVLDMSFTNPDYRNLSLDAVAAPAENSSNVEYGLVFWHGENEQGRESFLAFTLNTKGNFRLLAYEPVEDKPDVYQFREVTPAAFSAAIRQDKSPQKIRVDVHPRRLLGYVNDQLVLDTNAEIINDWRLRREWDGKVGIIALTMDAPGAQAVFSQFDIYADVKE